MAVVEVDASGHADWAMPAAADTQGFNSFAYVLRAYDAQGRFDETRPLTLARRAPDAVAPRRD